MTISRIALHQTTKRSRLKSYVLAGLSSALVITSFVLQPSQSAFAQDTKDKSSTIQKNVTSETDDSKKRNSKPEQDSKKTFGIQYGILPNGMDIYVIPNHRVPVVTHMVWYKVGSADEDWGQSGVAHFMEHLMFKGSKNVPSGEFSKIVKKLGGRDNAFTSYDFTAYHQSIAREHLETVMEMEADRMRGMVLTADDIIAERNVVIEERRQRTENSPENYFQEKLQAGLFINHPYGVPVIGWMNEIENLGMQDAVDFHKKWYRPDNAVLIVSGDVTLDELMPLAEKTYGQIVVDQSIAVPHRKWPVVPPIPGDSHFTLYDDNIQQRQFYRIYRVPSYNQNKDDALALQVLASILDDGSASRFYQSLVKEQKLAVNVGFSYSASALSDSRIWITGIPTDDVSLEELEMAIEAEIEKLIKDGIKNSEFKDAKLRMQDQAVFARDGVTGPAMIVGRMIATGSTIDDIEYWPQNIQNVKERDVINVADRYLKAEDDGTTDFITAHVYPEKYKDNPDLKTKSVDLRDMQSDTNLSTDLEESENTGTADQPQELNSDNSSENEGAE